MKISTTVFESKDRGKMVWKNSTTVFESKDRGKWPWKFPRQFLNPKTGKMVMEISTTVFESKNRENGHGNFQRHLLAEVLSFQRQRLKISMNDYCEKMSTLLLTPPKTFEIQFFQAAFSVRQ